MDAVETSEVETGGDVIADVADVEWHAARTHCTWPLPPRTEPATVDGQFIMEEDVQVMP